MGEHRNGILMNIFAGIGFVLLLGMAWYIATEKVLPQIQEMRGQETTVRQVEHPELAHAVIHID